MVDSVNISRVKPYMFPIIDIDISFGSCFSGHTWQADAIDYYFEQDIEFPPDDRWTSPGMRAIPVQYILSSYDTTFHHYRIMVFYQDISAQGIYYVFRFVRIFLILFNIFVSC